EDEDLGPRIVLDAPYREVGERGRAIQEAMLVGVHRSRAEFVRVLDLDRQKDLFAPGSKALGVHPHPVAGFRARQLHREITRITQELTEEAAVFALVRPDSESHRR